MKPSLSRKFLVSVLTILSASILCWFGHIADGVWSAAVIATVGGYLSANVIQKKAAPVVP